MSWLLKYYKGIYIVLVAVGVLCTYLSLWGTAVATGYFILVLASLVLGGRWLSRAVSRGVVEFYRDCDPEPLLANCDRLLAGAGDGRGGYLLALRCNRISALLALGRREEARAELDRFADAPPREKGSPAPPLPCGGTGRSWTWRRSAFRAWRGSWRPSPPWLRRCGCPVSLGV